MYNRRIIRTSACNRLLISLGLVMMGVFLGGYLPSWEGLQAVKILEREVFQTNCNIIFPKQPTINQSNTNQHPHNNQHHSHFPHDLHSNCMLASNYLPASFIASGCIFLLFGATTLSTCIACITLLSFGVFYTNPLIDKSFFNLTHCLGVVICITGILREAILSNEISSDQYGRSFKNKYQ